MLRFISVISACAVLFLCACSSFIKVEDVSQLKEMEKGKYQLKRDLVNNGKVVLKSGTFVRLNVMDSSEWVKVYARRAEESLLTSERFLVIYLFEDDFKNEKFDRSSFDKRMDEFLSLVPEEAGKPAPKKGGQK